MDDMDIFDLSMPSRGVKKRLIFQKQNVC